MNIAKLVSEIHRSIERADVGVVDKGGCGYVAFFIANELERYGIDYKIRVVDKDLLFLSGSPIEEKTSNLNNFMRNTEEIDELLISFTHCWIEVEQNGVLYKLGSGSYRGSLDSVDYQYSGFYTRKEMKIALRHGSWNNYYNNENNQKLRAAIREAFEVVHILRLLPII